MSRNKLEKRGRDPRVEYRKCSSCGHNKMWSSRSQTGQGSYSYKCTRCGYMVK